MLIIKCFTWPYLLKAFEGRNVTFTFLVHCCALRYPSSVGRPSLTIHIFNSFWNLRTGKIWWNLKGSKISRYSTKFVFFWADRKTKVATQALTGWDLFTSSLKPLNGIQWNLTGSKIPMSSTKFVFFELIGKPLATLVSDLLRHFLCPWPERSTGASSNQIVCLSVYLSVCLSVIPSHLHIKCNI